MMCKLNCCFSIREKLVEMLPCDVFNKFTKLK